MHHTNSSNQATPIRVLALALAVVAMFMGGGQLADDAQVLRAQSLGFDAALETGSLFNVTQVTGAGEYWNDGWTGAGIDVAIVDSGVSAVPGLDAPGKVVHGPDLSFEAGDPTKANRDTYGHGTHLAGIVAGRDASAPGVLQKDDGKEHFLGVAPGARIVSLKVASESGAADVSQVIAAVDWVVSNRNTDGRNIRVLLLAYGTDGNQSLRSDPLVAAVEAAWRHGIVVVVSAGNDAALRRLTTPARSRNVLAVGAVDGRGTYGTGDDVVPSWTAQAEGEDARRPDLVAPGVSIVSTLAPGSAAAGGTKVATRFVRGSGTSQAAAVVAGAAALVLEQRPWLTPDEVKALLVGNASPVDGISSRRQGAGVVDLKLARDASVWSDDDDEFEDDDDRTWSSGLGTLDGARGSMRVKADGIELTGQRSFTGSSWSGSSWSGSSWSGSSWSGSSWSGSSWSGSSWSGSSWSGSSWSGSSWSGSSWSGSSWSGSSWSGSSWSAGGWQHRPWA